MAYAKREDVEAFLSAFHRATQSGLHVVDREKNLNFLLLYGMSVDDRRSTIEKLCAEDYFGGPDRDKDFPDQPPCIWKFSVLFEGIAIYIKLKLVNIGTSVKAKCLSFHDPEQPITHFPHKR